MYGIYKLYNGLDLLYVGKTKDFTTRLRTHLYEKKWKNEITHIEIAECRSQIDMDIYEKYYINKLKAKYNIALVYNDEPTFKIEELNFKRYTLKEFINKNDNVKQVDKKVNKSMELRKQKMNDLLKNSIEVKCGEKINLFELDNNSIHTYNEDKSVVKILLLNGLEFWKNFLNNFTHSDYEKMFKEKHKITIKNGKEIWDNWEENDFRIKIYSYNISKGYSEGFQGINIIPTAKYDRHTDEIIVKIDRSGLDKIREYFIINI